MSSSIVHFGKDLIGLEPLSAEQFRQLNDVFGELMGSGVAAVNLVEYLAQGGPAAVAAEAGTGGQP